MSAPPDTTAPDLASPLKPREVNRGYSRFVGLAKRLLPSVAVVLLALVAIWPRIQEELDRLGPIIAQARLDPRDARDLRMVNVRYTGLDRQNRPFVITADVARQSPDVDQLMSLEGPKGDLTTAAGAWLELTAYSGLYQPETQMLELFGDVHLYQDKGDEFATDTAHVDLKESAAEGHDHVTGQGPFGHVEADGFRIVNRGDIIIFTGRAHLVLDSHQAKVEGQP
jgi:lipopolysaccharide export system protein LptC